MLTPWQDHGSSGAYPGAGRLIVAVETGDIREMDAGLRAAGRGLAVVFSLSPAAVLADLQP